MLNIQAHDMFAKYVIVGEKDKKREKRKEKDKRIARVRVNNEGQVAVIFSPGTLHMKRVSHLSQ